LAARDGLPAQYSGTSALSSEPLLLPSSGQKPEPALSFSESLWAESRLGVPVVGGATDLQTRLVGLLRGSGRPGRWPARWLAFFAAVAVGCGGAAFAVASMAPDASDLPVHQVVESVSWESAVAGIKVDEEDAAPGGQGTALGFYRSDTSRSGDTVDGLLRRLGLDDTAAAAFMRGDALVQRHLAGRAGRSLSAEAQADHRLKKLSVRWVAEDGGMFNRLVLEKTSVGFTSRMESAPLVASTRLASGTIWSSLFAATDDARLPDAIATQIAEIFSGDIDFHRALRKGDRFSLAYEVLEGDGEPLRTGRVLAAEFVNNGKKFNALWFAAPEVAGQEKRGRYFTLEGKSLSRAFLASPLEFSRVTSGFKMRLHPILQTWKQHLGVDYAAPTGTPVRSVADGIVAFAGVQRGFGNMVIVDHGKSHSTVYAHLSRVNVHKGEKISQSQNLGAVGTTGWSTGPHLHFEFRVAGVHRDPLTLARNSDAQPVPAGVKPRFDMLAAQTRVTLAAASSVQQATAQ
jgi:murein DD-endopeptidase MepM/ murein hydrolase activator NlpD